jgi:ABC-type phosphate transport system permease subunit
VIGAAGYTLLMLALVAFSVAEGSVPIFSLEGLLGFLFGTDWNPVEGRESYGALPYVIGTLISAGIAMAIGVPISLGIAVFVSEIAPSKIAAPVGYIVEILAAIPSIVYGFWALFVFRFWIVDFIERPLYEAFGGTLPRCLYGRNNPCDNDNPDNFGYLSRSIEGNPQLAERGGIQPRGYPIGDCPKSAFPLCKGRAPWGFNNRPWQGGW